MRNKLFALILGMAMLQPMVLRAQNKSQWKIQVTPNHATLQVGDTLQFLAKLVNNDGLQKDTTFDWHLTGPAIGSINSAGQFVAYLPGHAHVMASLEALDGKAQIHVNRDSTWAPWQVEITPQDIVLTTGDSVQLSAVLVDSSGLEKDTLFTWQVENDSVASLHTTGWLEGLSEGSTFVTARVGSILGVAPVHVVRDSSVWHYHMQLSIVISPTDTLVSTHAEIQYEAALLDSSGQKIDTTFSWGADAEVGFIDDFGFLVASPLSLIHI
jgi:hypothetical protein